MRACVRLAFAQLDYDILHIVAHAHAQPGPRRTRDGSGGGGGLIDLQRKKQTNRNAQARDWQSWSGALICFDLLSLWGTACSGASGQIAPEFVGNRLEPVVQLRFRYGY